MNQTTSKLVDGNKLLDELFEEGSSRPSLRWLREQQARGTIPFVKIGRLVRFYPEKVRDALDKNFTVK